MTLTELIAKRNEVNAKAKAVRAKAKTAEREMSDSEWEEFDNLVSESEKLSVKINRLQRAEKFDTDDAKLDESAGRKTRATQPKNDEDALDEDAERALGIQTHERLMDDPKKGFKSHNEFLLTVMSTYKNGGHQIKDKRLKLLAATEKKMLCWNRDELGGLHMTAGGDEQAVFTDPNGGFLVPEGFSPTLLQVDPEEDYLGGRVLRIPMQTPVVKIPARADKNHTTSVAGGLTISRRPESVAGATSQMSFEQVILEANSVFGGAYVSEELLMDSPISFVAILSKGFDQQWQYFETNERLNGTGTGERLGVNNAGCLIAVAKETGQATKTVVYQNILKMRSRCWKYSRAIWLANHDTYPQLATLNQAVGTGGQLVWQTGAQNDRPDMLLGRPLYFSEFPNTVGSQGDLVLGVWDEYIEGTYQPLQSAESIHVRFLNNERTFKFWKRDAGSPWWRTTLTPKQGANTLSPFVVLAAR